MQSLNVHVIARELNKLCSRLSSDYDINLGGCCFVAYEIAKHFDRLRLKYELRVYDNCGKDRQAINNEVRSKHRNNVNSKSVTGYNSCCHYFLWLEGAGCINHDPDYFKGFESYSITKINHTNIRWIYKVSKWNDCYDVRNNIKIKRIINSYFKRYEKVCKIKTREVS